MSISSRSSSKVWRKLCSIKSEETKDKRRSKSASLTNRSILVNRSRTKKTSSRRAKELVRTRFKREEMQ